ncbi:hypothetical protein FQR65_LT06454 [Abscondita terminalis]|nr:hypothetical protein FQR65_LT06454 [Abscondita terminalis]
MYPAECMYKRVSDLSGAVLKKLIESDLAELDLDVIIGVLLILMGDSIVEIYNDLDIFIESHYFSPALFSISIGSIILLVSLFGCIGALMRSTMAVNIYTLFMCILLILEIAAAITAFVKRQDIETLINTSMYHSMNFYKNDTDYAESWNYIQYQFSCCGVHNFTDWTIHKIDEANIVIGSEVVGLPKSCCANRECIAAFGRGCLDYITTVISASGFLLGIGALSVSIVQIMGIVFGTMLVKTIRQVKSREEMIRQQRNMLYDQINNGKSTIYG